MRRESVLDTLRRPRDDDEAASAGGGAAPLRLACSLADGERVSRRALVDVRWSPRHAELLLGAYVSHDHSDAAPFGPPPAAVRAAAPRAAAAAAAAAPGLVLLWTLDAPTRAEFAFTADSPVMCASFCGGSAHLLLGGTHSGQVVLWDTRAQAAPVQRSAAAGRGGGHTLAVTCIESAGTANAHAFVTASADGRLCAWNLAALATPAESLELRAPDDATAAPSGLPRAPSAAAPPGGRRAADHRARLPARRSVALRRRLRGRRALPAIAPRLRRR